MAASNMICETSTPSPSTSLSLSTDAKHGGGGTRKSKKIITIDLSSISCLLKRRDDITNTYNTIQDDGKEEKDEYCREDNESMNNNIEAKDRTDAEADAEADADTDADTDADADTDGGKNGYYYRNREKKLEYQKNYNREQGDKIKNYNKDYYQKRREEILEKAKTKIICECGCEVQLFNMNSHKKTKKHAKALAAINGKIRILAN